MWYFNPLQDVLLRALIPPNSSTVNINQRSFNMFQVENLNLNIFDWFSDHTKFTERWAAGGNRCLHNVLGKNDFFVCKKKKKEKKKVIF